MKIGWQIFLTIVSSIVGGFVAGLIGFGVYWRQKRDERKEKEKAHLLEILGYIEAFCNEIRHGCARVKKLITAPAETDPFFATTTSIRDHYIARFTTLIQDPVLLRQINEVYDEFDRLNRIRNKSLWVTYGEFHSYMVEETSKKSKDALKLLEQKREEISDKLAKLEKEGRGFLVKNIKKRKVISKRIEIKDIGNKKEEIM